jgi:hypothetical protein
MTNKAIQKILTTNCEKIANIVNEMYNALDEFGDDELSEITLEWLNEIDERVNVDQDNNTSLYDSIEYINTLEE